MKKNLLYQEAVESILSRVHNLQVDNKPLWGQMNATEMLLHVNLCNQEIFDATVPARRTTFKQYLLRIIALYIAPNFKKGIKGDIKKETVGRIAETEFDKQKAQFIELTKRFPQHKSSITLPHIAFGNISTNEWGIAVYKHIDHRLRQFGV